MVGGVRRRLTCAALSGVCSSAPPSGGGGNDDKATSAAAAVVFVDRALPLRLRPRICLCLCLSACIYVRMRVLCAGGCTWKGDVASGFGDETNMSNNSPSARLQDRLRFSVDAQSRRERGLGRPRSPCGRVWGHRGWLVMGDGGSGGGGSGC